MLAAAQHSQAGSRATVVGGGQAAADQLALVIELAVMPFLCAVLQPLLHHLLCAPRAACCPARDTVCMLTQTDTKPS